MQIRGEGGRRERESERGKVKILNNTIRASATLPGRLKLRGKNNKSTST